MRFRIAFIVCLLSIPPVWPADAGERVRALAITHSTVRPYAEVLEGMEESRLLDLDVIDPADFLASSGTVRCPTGSVLIAIGPDAVRAAAIRCRHVPLAITYILDEQRYLRRFEKRCSIFVSILPDPEEVLSLVASVLPPVRSVGVIWPRDIVPEYRRRGEEAAQRLGLRLIGLEAGDPREISALLPEVLKESDCFWWIPSARLFPQALQDHVLEKAFKLKIPVVGGTEKAAHRGCIFSLCTDNRALGRQLATVAAGLQNARCAPGVETVFHNSPVLQYNLRLLKYLGLSPPGPAAVGGGVGEAFRP